MKEYINTTLTLALFLYPEPACPAYPACRQAGGRQADKGCNQLSDIVK